jgi:hypothetical protein
VNIDAGSPQGMLVPVESPARISNYCHTGRAAVIMATWQVQEEEKKVE